ncbi:B12-binding domain-containing radical SAM protein [bacterium]|nr:B12-binding domain-containing radical SAM protein [bacterium]
MNIFLTVPFHSFRHSHPPLPDLGLGYLASALLAAGHSVMINDWNDRSNPDQMAHKLRSFQPDLVGLKFFTLNVRAAQRTLVQIRSVLGDECMIVLGGPHPSAEEALWLHQDFPEAQGRFIGEAEEALRLLCDQVVAGSARASFQPEQPVPGFEPLGQPHHQPVAGIVIDQLDRLAPPAWDLIKPEAYPAFKIDGKNRVLAPLMATRGCPLGCRFCCTELISGRRIRHHSPEYLLDQINYLRKYHAVSALSFLDTNFMTDTAWLQTMLHKLGPLGDELVWNCVWGLNPNAIDQQLLVEMRRAGCTTIIMGIESGNNQIRSASGKKDTIDTIREQVDVIRRVGINVHGFFMLGFFDESLAQMLETIDLGFSLPLEALSFSLLFPLPGTGYYQDLKCKYQISRIDWAHFNIYSSPYPLSRLSSTRLSLVRRYTQLRNILSPRRFRAEIRRGILSGQVIRSKLKQLLSHSDENYS